MGETMKKEIIEIMRKLFEEKVNVVDNIECWFARDLQKLLEYDEWRNFLNVIEKIFTNKNKKLWQT